MAIVGAIEERQPLMITRGGEEEGERLTPGTKDCREIIRRS
jgi:hypothetical protein